MKTPTYRNKQSYQKNNVPNNSVITLSMPVVVPSDFAGICWIEYPDGSNSTPTNANTSPVGILSWKKLRTNQMTGFRWSSIQAVGITGYTTGNTLTISTTLANSSAIAVGQIIYGSGITGNGNVTIISGSSNTWILSANVGTLGSSGSPVPFDIYSGTTLATLDAIVTFQKQNNANIIFGLYGTPTMYADAANAHPTYTDAITKGAWGGLGENGNPTSLQAVNNFTSMVVSRYNTANGAWYSVHGGTLGKGINAWETWNEPSFNNTNGNVTGFNGSGAGFFYGTAAQSVDLSQTQYAAIKAIDPSITVLTPGFNPYTLGVQWLTTTGTYTGKTGGQSCDAFAFHPYQSMPFGSNFGTWNTTGLNDIVYNVNTLRNLLTGIGYGSLPLWITDYGLDASGLDANETNWQQQPSYFRYVFMGRLLMTMAALGIKVVCFWHWQETGDLVNGYIAGNTLTITSMTIGTQGQIPVGATLGSQSGVANLTIITANTGSQNVWTLSGNQTVGSSGSPVPIKILQIGNCGDWQGDSQGITQAFNDSANNVNGKTMTRFTAAANGQVSTWYSDGSSWIL